MSALITAWVLFAVFVLYLIREGVFFTTPMAVLWILPGFILFFISLVAPIRDTVESLIEKPNIITHNGASYFIRSGTLGVDAVYTTPLVHDDVKIFRQETSSLFNCVSSVGYRIEYNEKPPIGAIAIPAGTFEVSASTTSPLFPTLKSIPDGEVFKLEQVSDGTTTWVKMPEPKNKE